MPQSPGAFPETETPFFIEGPAGPLEALGLASKSAPKGVGIVCHPHPLFEGTMHNKVVHTLSRAFHRKSCHALRFNFRGVGKSQGTFGDSVGEVHDLNAVVAWVRAVLPDLPLYLAGFSFGAYIAAKGAMMSPCRQLFSIAPAVPNQPYDTLAIDCPWTVIQGTNDEVINYDEVKRWFSAYPKQDKLQFIEMPGASHFFHSELITLRGLVEDSFIDPTS